MKECTKCGESLPSTLQYFYKNREKLSSRCKQCLREMDRERFKKDPKKHRNYQLKNKYNITIDEWDRIFEEQKGRCRICGIHQLELRYRLNTDHNHKTGKVRGLLCIDCNIGLRYLDDEEFIIKAKKYLKGEL